MQGSRPHCAEVVHVFPPGGIGRQLPATQKFPFEHWVLLAHPATHRPALQVKPALQSELLEHFGLGLQRLFRHEQDEWQSLFDEHEAPGQPNVQSAK
jgi:hypothetical protein